MTPNRFHQLLHAPGNLFAHLPCAFVFAGVRHFVTQPGHTPDELLRRSHAVFQTLLAKPSNQSACCVQGTASG
jgi:hypothetical protein